MFSEVHKRGYQTTLCASATCSGVGLHTGREATLTLKPAPADHGIVFRRMDLLSSGNPTNISTLEAATIRAHVDNVVRSHLGTVLENEHGECAETVEHVMAALSGCGVDNVLVELNSPETPIMDGSSTEFVEMIGRAGVRALDRRRRVLRVLEEVAIQHGDRKARFEPAEALELDLSIEFEDPAIGRQHIAYSSALHCFRAHLSKARTFCLLKDVDAMRQNGMAIGGSLDNAVVVDDGKILNEGGLNCQDEFARHKALDVIGDFALAGAPILGRATLERPGHELNYLLLRALFDRPEAWVFDEVIPADARTKDTARAAYM